ncbi:MAG TPA: hypothetical protein VN026_02085 [Bacteroidia bacterium]|jgi:hypothetical protein|nr:hypothetical protein [Bacteroidia bacterium]
MKKIKYILLIVSLNFLGHAQVIDKQTKITHVDSPASDLLKSKVLVAQPTDVDFNIIDDAWVNRMSDFAYWDKLFDKSFKKTLFVCQGNDSILTVDSPSDKYTFMKTNNKWLIQNADLISSNLTFNHITVGSTSKETFKILEKNIKKKVGKGVVWVTTKDQKKLFAFTFVNDKITRMQLQ